MKLRTFSKQPLSHMVVHGIENAEKNKRSVASWIDRISELHQGKPPPTINYSKPMPGMLFFLFFYNIKNNKLYL